MSVRDRDYSRHVVHPRFGQSPRFTGLDPDPRSPGVFLHWNTGQLTPLAEQYLQQFGVDLATLDDGARMVPGTALSAIVERQQPATVQVTHYYDIDKVCRDCGLRFIFFAEEQKYWYEELGFRLEIDAVRCQICRRRQQQIARTRQRYEELSRVPARKSGEELEMAECCLFLVEERIFHVRQLSHVRELRNRIPQADRDCESFQRLTDRLTDVSHRLE